MVVLWRRWLVPECGGELLEDGSPVLACWPCPWLVWRVLLRADEMHSLCVGGAHVHEPADQVEQARSCDGVMHSVQAASVEPRTKGGLEGAEDGLHPPPQPV